MCLPKAMEQKAQIIWDTLHSAGFPMPADAVFSDFCTADNELAVSKALTDAATVQSVQAADGSATG